MSYQAPIPRPVPLSSHVSVTMRLAVRLMRDCVGLSQQRWGFGIEAAVVLPSEVQLLCSFPVSEFGVCGALRLITTAFARHVPGVLQGDHDAILSDNTEIIEITHSVVALRSRFIENAPMRAGLVKCPEDWLYSSANKKTSQSSDMGVAVA